MNNLPVVIILAAGEGTRLRPHTLHRPKCLVPVGGQTVLGYQQQVLKSLGLSDIYVVTGYQSKLISDLGCRTFHNPNFDKTNMVASLMCAKDLLDGQRDVLICYGDIIYEPRLIKALLEQDFAFSTTVDILWKNLWRIRHSDPMIDAETLIMDVNDEILELGQKPQSEADIQAQYMGLIKLRKDFAPVFVDAYGAIDPQQIIDGQPKYKMFMTSYLQHLISLGNPLKAVKVSGGWIEIDSTEDLEIYEELLSRGQLKEFCAVIQR